MRIHGRIHSYSANCERPFSAVQMFCDAAAADDDDDVSGRLLGVVNSVRELIDRVKVSTFTVTLNRSISSRFTSHPSPDTKQIVSETFTLYVFKNIYNLRRCRASADTDEAWQ